MYIQFTYLERTDHEGTHLAGFPSRPAVKKLFVGAMAVETYDLRGEDDRATKQAAEASLSHALESHLLPAIDYHNHDFCRSLI